MSTDANYYSYVNTILLSLLGGAGVIMMALLGYWASDVNRRLKDLADTCSKHSITLAIQTDWSSKHDHSDDERHRDLKTGLTDNYQLIQMLRGELTGWRSPLTRLERSHHDSQGEEYNR